MTELASDVVTAHQRDGRGSRSTVVAALAVAVAATFVVAVLTLTHGDSPAGVLAAGLRFVRYAGTLVAAGAFVFVGFVTPAGDPDDTQVRRVVLAAGVSALAAALVALPVEAAYLAGDLGAVGDGAAIAAVSASGFGTSVAVGSVGILLLLLAVTGPLSPLRTGLGSAGTLLAIGSFLLTGHSVTSQPQTLALTANLAHTLAGAVWLGGLVSLPIALAARRRADDAAGGAALVARFSTLATGAVVAVAIGGAALAWVQVRTFSALWTPYGLTLAGKVALVAAVAGMGAYNNRRLVPTVRDAGDAGWGRLSRLVRLESLALVAVLAVTAVLVNVVPARVEAGIDAQVVRIAAMGTDHTMTLQVQPARPGSNELHLYVEHDQRLLGQEASDVTLTFAPPGGGPERTIEPAQVGPGHWLHLGRELDAAGTWSVTVDGLIDGEERSVTVDLPVVAVGG